jgi:phage FluMu protein Com
MAGFVAISASAAQAEGTWLNNGTTITSNTGINAEAETEGILLTKVGLSAVEILCPKIKFVNAVLTSTGGATGKIHFEECITKLNKTEAPKCKPHSGTSAAGLIETEALDGSERLNGGVQYFELLPVSSSEIFVTLTMGAECAIGNNINITGKVFLKDCEGKSATDLKKHLFSEEPALSTLLFGGNKATIDGSAWAFLTGANEGHTFAGHV